MKTTPSRTMLAAFVAAAFMAGCTSQSTTAPDQSGTTPQSGTQSGAQSSATPQSGGPGTASSGSRDPREAFAKRSVYYEFDGYDVKPEYRPLVEAHAAYLKQNPSARITIEGNCDERGSREYNLALGQRRAEAVKRVMTVMGVGENRIETVSFGEEKPKNPGHDEAAWAENRRADIRYAGE